MLSRDSEDEFDQDLCLNLWYDLKKSVVPLAMFLLRDGTGRVLAKKFAYRDGSGGVVKFELFLCRFSLLVKSPLNPLGQELGTLMWYKSNHAVNQWGQYLPSDMGLAGEALVHGGLTHADCHLWAQRGRKELERVYNRKRFGGWEEDNVPQGSHQKKLFF